MRVSLSRRKHLLHELLDGRIRAARCQQTVHEAQARWYPGCPMTRVLGRLDGDLQRVVGCDRRRCECRMPIQEVQSGMLESVAVQVLIRAVACLAGFLLIALVGAYALIKISAHVMSRVGPMYPGRVHGLAWPIAEGVKWIQKEDLVPRSADRTIFKLAPLVIMSPVIMLLAVIPIAPGLVAVDLDLGLFFFLAMSAVGAIGVVMVAYASASKFTLLGGLRAVGQLIAYEIPLVLASVSVAMWAGSLSLTKIMEAQRLPFVAWPLPFGILAFGIFFMSSLAEVQWAPFDMPVAESEIVAGPLTELSGMRYFLILVTETAHAVLLAALAVLLFFGGWKGPVLPPVLWFLIKSGAMTVAFIWIRFTLPRLREDQLQKLAWKLFIPLALLNVLGIAIVRVTTG